MSSKRLAGTIGCIIAIIVIAATAISCGALPRPKINYMPTADWGVFSLIPYEEALYEGEYDDQAGFIGYANQVTYDSIQIYYEQAPNWDWTPSALEQAADYIFQRDLGYIPDETGIMATAGTTAGYAKGYNSDFDVYELELVLVLDHIYMDMYAAYATLEIEDQILDMIDSITL